MLVRFNKGPWHRKVRDVTESDAARGVIQVAVHDPKAMQRCFELADGGYAMVTPGHKIATYRLKMVTVNLRGKPETLPSVYPDGAVCFELEGVF